MAGAQSEAELTVAKDSSCASSHPILLLDPTVGQALGKHDGHTPPMRSHAARWEPSPATQAREQPALGRCQAGMCSRDSCLCPAQTPGHTTTQAEPPPTPHSLSHCCSCPKH